MKQLAEQENRGKDQMDSSSPYGFFAMLDRMQFISRWGLMRNNRTENLKEHSMDVAVVTHALAVIRNTCCLEGREIVDPYLAAALAIFHDASEIITGDLPTPIKYRNEQITKAYKVVEAQATDSLLGLLPDCLKDEYSSLLHPDLCNPLISEAYSLVKCADKICAYIKCLTEERSGNCEFISAKETILAAINQLPQPEVAYFIEHFIPAYGMTLDQINE